MKNCYWIGSMLRHAIALALCVMLPGLAVGASVSVFTPEGKISDTQQVRASFDEAMLPLGSIDAADPFTIACPMRGRSHWINQNTWVWDMPAADPEGQKCTFTLRDDLKTLAGKPVTGKRVFGFELPALTYNQRIRIAWVQPSIGSVREDQLFLVTFDHPIQSPRPSLYCISDDQQRRPVVVDDADQEPIRQGRLGVKNSSLALRCPGALPERSRVQLVLDRGPGRDTSAFEFHVRGPVGAEINCEHVEGLDCALGRPIEVKFNSVISEQFLRDIRLRTPSGPQTGTTRIVAAQQFLLGSSSVTFDLKLDPKQTYQIEYPPNMVDVDGRHVQLGLLPSEIKTSDTLAIVGFTASNIAMVRRSPNASLQVLLDHHPRPVHIAELVVGNDADAQAADKNIIQWLDNPDVWQTALKFYKNPEQFRTAEMHADHAGSLSVPLREAGLHIFLTAQSVVNGLAGPDTLQKELDAGAVPESAEAIATSMAVYIKTSQENGAVWVSYLDDGKPVVKAKVRIYDPDLLLIWEGDTDSNGLARIPRPMQAPYYTAIVRAADRAGKKDISFTRTGWDNGISRASRYWLFGRHSYQAPIIRADSIVDRSLVKPGEKISMRTVIRSETSSGLSYLKPASRPTTLRIAHDASGQHWDFPLNWDHDDDALTTFDVPMGAPLGGYTITLLWGSARDADYNTISGSFSVAAYRVPSLSGELSLGSAPILEGSRPVVSLNMRSQDGSPEMGLPVKVSVALNRYPVDGARLPGFSEDPSHPVAHTDFWPRDGQPVMLQNQQLTLDRNGNATFTLAPLPKLDQDYALHLEASYLDTSGEVQTITRVVNVRRSPLRLQVAVLGQGNVGSTVEIRVRSIADDDRVRAHEKVSIQAEFSDATDTGSRVPLGAVCSAVTDATGFASCFYKLTRAGRYFFIASGNDERGIQVASESWYWAVVRPESIDNLFLDPDKPQYRAGDVAHIRVTTPFEVSRAWLAVEREGVINSKIVTLNGQNSEIEVPIDASYGPNVFLSLLAIPPAERLPEGDLPQRAMGTVSLGVARDSNTLHVSVASERHSYMPRQTAQLHIHVTGVDGKPAVGPLRASLAVVDEALLDLKDNSSWNLLDLMMQQRANSVSTATPLRMTVPHDTARRVHQLQDELMRELRTKPVPGSSGAPGYALAPAPMAGKASSNYQLDRVTVTGSNLRRADTETPSPVQSITLDEGAERKRGNSGSSLGMRRIASSLLLWQPDVTLDHNGDATISVPVNDSLSRFRAVAVVSGGNQQFGTGSTDLVVTQDVQIVSGLAPLVREGDSLKEIVTLRSRAARVMQLDISAKEVSVGSVLAPNQIILQPGEARDISFDFSVPKSTKTLQFEISAIETGHPDNGDRLAVEQGVLASTPIEVMASTFDQLKPNLEIPVAAPPGSLAGSTHIEVSLQARLAEPMPAVIQWMRQYPFNCIEQRTSIALVTHDKAALQALFQDLPKYLDDDGLVNYFPTDEYTRQKGSDVLTAYLLEIAKTYDVKWPDAPQAKMLEALARFARGQLERNSWAPLDDTKARRLAAIAGLSLYGRSDAAMLQGIKVDVDDWTTAMLIDWLTVLRHTPNLPPQQITQQRVGQQLHARLTYQGRRAVLSNEKRDFWFWVMQSGDADTARLILAMMDQPDWREEMPRLVQGLLARQSNGAWMTTVANAWGVAAMEKFSAAFESQPVSGITTVELDAQRASMHLNDSDNAPPPAIKLPLSAKTSALRLTQVGSGSPWATVSVYAAVPLTKPLYAGYTIDKSVVPISQKVQGVVSVGDTYRVKLSIEAQSDSSWVVIRDPVAAGVSILGNGLGRDSADATRGEQPTGDAWPEYTERDFTVYRSYYRFVPRGKFSTEYTIRVNNPGTFLLPPTRVEAMYAPDVFGEIPNPAFKVLP